MTDVIGVMTTIPRSKPARVRFRALPDGRWVSDAVIAVRYGGGRTVHPVAIEWPRHPGVEIAVSEAQLEPFRDAAPHIVGWAHRPDIGWDGAYPVTAERPYRAADLVSRPPAAPGYTQPRAAWVTPHCPECGRWDGSHSGGCRYEHETEPLKVPRTHTGPVRLDILTPTYEAHLRGCADVAASLRRGQTKRRGQVEAVMRFEGEDAAAAIIAADTDAADAFGEEPYTDRYDSQPWLIAEDSVHIAPCLDGIITEAAKAEAIRRVRAERATREAAATERQAAEARAAELEAKAAGHEREARDSFERCDTDGFLSQWASGLNAQKLRRQADIERNDGKGLFPALFREGRLVPAVVVETRYGARWALFASAEDANRHGADIIAWLPTGESLRANRKWGLRGEGYTQGFTERPARAVITGEGRGLSGRAWVANKVIGPRFDPEAEIYETDAFGPGGSLEPDA